ncbi:Polyketide cyclase / dehydrase and lipid transport [Cylindrospermum stagnale PCC 7417]|uniref:Polyketide cyclase / dehydrase and lipid transport n=2 Tax=Cylindrospermum stagnale TaxID=142864 RepID=K9X4I9_9NOST|nr:Polyketide cyclase / dehydrase and lipid transport [Cylindrospermum stagnale PCC 7417]
MKITTIAEIMIKADIEDVFDSSTDDQNLPRYFTGYKLIPAIVSARTTDSLPLHQGSKRIITNRDGSEIVELITALKRPAIQEYKLIQGFKPPFSLLVDSAAGRWLYTSGDSGTRIVWNFEFKMKNYLAYLFFLVAVKMAFQKAQVICLENLKSFLESPKADEQVFPS